MLLSLSALAAPAVPSLEARMNADTAGKDMHAQERKLAGHPVSHYMPVGLVKDAMPTGEMKMPMGARVEVMPNMRSEAGLMPSGSEGPEVVHPNMEASLATRAAEEREEERTERAISRHATMLFAPETASRSERSGEPTWMAAERLRSQ